MKFDCYISFVLLQLNKNNKWFVYPCKISTQITRQPALMLLNSHLGHLIHSLTTTAARVLFKFDAGPIHYFCIMFFSHEPGNHMGRLNLFGKTKPSLLLLASRQTGLRSHLASVNLTTLLHCSCGNHFEALFTLFVLPIEVNIPYRFLLDKVLDLDQAETFTVASQTWQALRLFAFIFAPLPRRQNAATTPTEHCNNGLTYPTSSLPSNK